MFGVRNLYLATMMQRGVITSFSRSFHVSPAYWKSKAGRQKPSKFNNKPLTYDQSFKPHMIGHRKGWLSHHTGNLHGEEGASARMYEDRFIRRFMEGTFNRMMSTPVVIKRRFNIIEVIAFVNCPRGKAHSMYFYQAYSERLLSAFFKCVVKLYIQHVDPQDTTYRYI